MQKYVGDMVRNSVRVQIAAENERFKVRDLDDKLESRRVFQTANEYMYIVPVYSVRAR